MNKLRILRWEDYLGLSVDPNVTINVTVWKEPEKSEEGNNNVMIQAGRERRV